MTLATGLFLPPGNQASSLLHAVWADDRMIIRALINMLFWNVIVVVGALALYR